MARLIFGTADKYRVTSAPTIVLLGFLVFFAPRPAAAANPIGQAADDSRQGETAQASEDVTQIHVTGQVVDANGDPVPETMIFSPIQDRSHWPQDFRQSETDGLGRFDLTLPKSATRFDNVFVWFYKPGFGIRTAAMGVVTRGKREAHGLIIPLPKSHNYRFKIRQPDGSPLAFAGVAVDRVEIPNGLFLADHDTGLIGILPPALLALTSTRTDESGFAEINTIAEHLFNAVLVDSDQFGKQRFGISNEPPDRIDLTVRKCGAIRGHLLTGRPMDFQGLQCSIESETWRGGASGKGIANFELDENASFEIPAIAWGDRLQIRFYTSDELPAHPVLEKVPELSPGKSLDLHFPVKPLVKLTGRILTADTNQPVPDARISLRSQDCLITVYGQTDASGTYTARVVPGTVTRQVFSMGMKKRFSSYDYPRLDPIEVPADVGELLSEPILLEPKKLIKGRLLDSAGNPISGATVAATRNPTSRFFLGRGETDKDGRFEIAVRDWERRGLPYREPKWVTIEQNERRDARHLVTELEVAENDPDAMRLVQP